MPTDVHIKQQGPYIKQEPSPLRNGTSTSAGGRVVYLLRCRAANNEESNPFQYYVKLGYPKNLLTSLLGYIRDELVDSSRPACYFEPSKLNTSTDANDQGAKTEPSESENSSKLRLDKRWPWKTSELATLSPNLLKDFLQTLYVFEDFIIFGWITCVCHLLYDICISPLHALVVLFRLFRYCIIASLRTLNQGLYSTSPRLALHYTVDKLVKPLSSLLGRGPNKLENSSSSIRRLSNSSRHEYNQPSRRTSLSCDIPVNRERYKFSSNRQRAKSTLVYDAPSYFKDSPFREPTHRSSEAVVTDPLPWMSQDGYKLAPFPDKPRNTGNIGHSRLTSNLSTAGKSPILMANPDLIVSEPESEPNTHMKTFNGIAASDITSLMIVSIALITCIIFRSVFDVSGVYHFIRGQSLLKLYVAFNMLEIVERMWRSFELDVFDNLRVHIDRTMSSFLTQTEHGLHRRQLTTVLGLIVRFSLAVICASVHTIMHLLRGLLLCIAMNSEESAMFLIIVTNNFAEIKSTVFKKQSGSTLWVLAVGDVLERVYLCADALFVYLQTSFSPQFSISSSFLVLRWLTMMLALEIVVDFFKHSFLIKFNSLSASIFKDFKKVMMMDVLIARCPTFVLTSKTSISNVSIPVPSQGLSGFPCVATRRIGLTTIPILTLFLQSIPYKRFFNPDNAIYGGVVLGLTWLALVCTLIILQMILLNISILKIGKEIPLNEVFCKLKPL